MSTPRARPRSESFFGLLDLRARQFQTTGLLFLPLPVPSGDHEGCLNAVSNLVPKPMKTNCLTTLALAALAASTLTANASSVITSYETVTGPRDGNQAGPMWGQFITPDIGSAGGPHGTLYLQSLSYQAADDGTRATGEVYLHAYTTFSTDGGGAITELGGFTAASTSTVDLGAIDPNGTLTWTFAGNDAFSASTSYIFVPSTSPTEVTFADTSSLVGAAYALDVGDLYAGGDSLRGNGGNTGWDQHFEATFDTVAVPEPSTAGLFGFAGLTLLLRRRRR
jgi:hypothetical protein